jgi:hypothetical protein
LLFADSFVYVKGLEPPFFFFIGAQPDVSVWVGWMKGLKEGGGTGAEEILGGDEVGRGCVVGG